MGTTKVVGIVRSVAKIRLTDNEACKAEVEDAAMHLGIGDGLLASIGIFYLVAVLCWCGTYGKEIARGQHLVEGRLADITREGYRILIAENLIGAAAGRSYEYQ